MTRMIPGLRIKWPSRFERFAFGHLPIVGAAMLGGLTACASVTMNESLSALPNSPGEYAITEDGYRFGTLAEPTQSDDILLVVAFSGGGKRSSSFSYGVLQGLRDFELDLDGRSSTLLDEIDIISGVSGGSFTAAYYALHRDAIFTDYEDAFLRRDIEGDVGGILLLPWNWEWMFNPDYGTGDNVAELYDEIMFQGATFADLHSRGAPLLQVNATNIVNESVFTFDQDYFDLICSDVMSFPLARAVAASNGFPVLFTPITLENHAEACADSLPAFWLEPPATEPGRLSRQDYLAGSFDHYLDHENTHYVHLMDGGISDNLAVRGLLNIVLLLGTEPDTLRAFGLDRVRRVVVLVGDGQGGIDESLAQERTVGGIGQIFGLVSGTQIDQYNYETLLLIQDTVDVLVEAVRETRCQEAAQIDGHACDDVEGYLVHLSLNQIEDSALQERLQAIPTALTLTDEEVDLLANAGRDLVAGSAALESLRHGLSGGVPSY